MRAKLTNKPLSLPKLLWGGALLLTALLALSCYRTETTETREWLAPNWTPDGKIVFIEEYTLDRTKINPILGSKDFGGGHTTLTLCEINRDGSGLRRLAVFYDEDYPSVPIAGPISTSASQDKIVISWALEGRRIIATLNRDGSGYKEIAQGAYADFSPDGKRIVYQKYEGDQPKGIWIMDLESGEEREIIPPERASRPSWSPEGGRILVWRQIYDTLGNLIFDSFPENYCGLDWSASDTNKVAGALVENHVSRIALFDFSAMAIVETTDIRSGSCLWSPDGEWFIVEASHDGITGYFIVNKEGTTWIPLQP